MSQFDLFNPIRPRMPGVHPNATGCALDRRMCKTNPPHRSLSPTSRGEGTSNTRAGMSPSKTTPPLRPRRVIPDRAKRTHRPPPRAFSPRAKRTHRVRCPRKSSRGMGFQPMMRVLPHLTRSGTEQSRRDLGVVAGGRGHGKRTHRLSRQLRGRGPNTRHQAVTQNKET